MTSSLLIFGHVLLDPSIYVAGPPYLHTESVRLPIVFPLEYEQLLTEKPIAPSVIT